jgi:putative FmdB family regulatory protein
VPVYEYRCANGHHFDKHEGFDAPRIQSCAVCGATATRQISLPAVIFKGPGFYNTDNRGSSRGGNGKSGESDSSVPSSASSDDHGHSHGDGGHSHGSESKPKTEAPAGD